MIQMSRSIRYFHFHLATDLTDLTGLTYLTGDRMPALTCKLEQATDPWLHLI